ncbi:TonB-dependent receptor [Myroides sp. DF42-4-2]|uniref:SusC/RagA family TonB-linked outer membrane protein n=1 Tax=unclassified Myroides TaxID=2642485 RepID=UPI002578886A|nr:TonB-dependent receptor [Myroides sp. DF42-4-2]MDM1407060.1 TonB-dependent receptor [Myroides sp. DF42-4-2]
MKNKLYLLLFFLIATTGWAQKRALNEVEVRFSSQEVTVAQIIEVIEKQTEFQVFLDKTINTKNKISLPAQTTSLQNVLHTLQSNWAIAYQQDDHFLSLKQAKFQGKSMTASGVLVATDGLTLPGATVVNLNSKQSTMTDLNGVFSIEAKESDLLEFSFMGYQSIVQKAATGMHLTLSEQASALDEIVVIGYGTVKKKDLTGSVGQVSGQLIEERNTTQVSQALQGQMSGVTVTRNSNKTGTGATIRVRGITTIGDSNPLIVVDGVAQDNIDEVNPNDIAEISVLKDASAASIYGARAAAGVILITTKRAKSGEFLFNYKADFGIDKPTAIPKPVDYKRYMEMMNELSWNDAANPENGQHSIYSQEAIQSWKQNNALNPDQFPITDWQDILLKKAAYQQRHAFSMSGGGEKTKSRLSITYDNNEAMYAIENFKRIMMRLNTTVDINSFLSGDVDFSYNSTNQTSPVTNPVWEAIRYAPIYAATWKDGRIAEGKTGSNAYARLHYGGQNKHYSDKAYGRFALHITPVTDLKVSLVVAPQLYFNRRKNFTKQIPYYDAQDPTRFNGYINGHASTQLVENRNEGKQLTKQVLINYNKTFDDHSFNLLAGYEDNFNSVESLGASATNMELDNYPYLDLAPVDYMTNSGSKYETAYRSFFGRLIYNYKEKYHLQANVRKDGSSRFHSKYRWGTFPSVSVGWTVSNEEFMQDQNVFSNLKLRGSWGTLGNERIGNYPYQSSIGFSNTLFYQDGQILSSLTAAQIQYAIENITWETTTSTDFGVDMYFLNNRLGITADYYKKKTKDMLLELEIPAFMGFENPNQNAGEMHTEGWDLDVTWRDQIQDFKYNIGLNVSDSKTRMGNLNNRIVISNNQIIREATPYNAWYGYVAEGLFQSQEDIDNSALLTVATKPGDVKYKDISGPDGVPDGKISADYDRVPLGNSLPRFTYGGSIHMEYKGIELGMAFQGVGKRQSLLTEEQMRPFQSSWASPMQEIDGRYWSLYNTESQNLAAKYPRLSQSSAESNNYKTSSLWLVNGAYFRIKNITLAYNFPKELTKPILIDRLRVYMSLNDFFTVSNYPKGFDPETLYNSYITKSVNFGVSVNF